MIGLRIACFYGFGHVKYNLGCCSNNFLVMFPRGNDTKAQHTQDIKRMGLGLRMAWFTYLALFVGNLLRSGDVRGYQSMARMYTRLAAMPKKGWNQSIAHVRLMYWCLYQRACKITPGLFIWRCNCMVLCRDELLINEAVVGLENRVGMSFAIQFDAIC